MPTSTDLQDDAYWGMPWPDIVRGVEDVEFSPDMRPLFLDMPKPGWFGRYVLGRTYGKHVKELY